MKRRAICIVCLAVAGGLALSLTACAPKSPEEGKGAQSQGGAAGGALFSEPTELSMVISSHVSWPYNENWAVWKYIEEATNARLKIRALPSSDQDTKLSLMMASPDTLPDLLHIWQKKTQDDYALSGAYLSYDDYEELLPNFHKFWDSLAEEERKDYFAQHTAGDGKLYSAPSYGTHTVNNLFTWMYRKDVLEKNDLTVPTTTEELYETAKKLKEVYPESYPVCFRTGFEKLDVWGPSWAPYFSYQPYYDYTENAWKYGAREPVMKEMVEYLLKLKKEKLVPPDYISMETKSWEELMSTDRGFITLDYIVRIDFFNKPNRQVNPEYTLALMAPPKPASAQGAAKLKKTNIDAGSYCVCNTGKKERIENAFKFVDWMYTDAACELLSWGKEGESYEVKEGRRQFILQGDETPQNKYGIGSYGTYERMDTAANEAMYSEEQVAACHDVQQYLEPRSNPLFWLPLDEQEQADAAALKDDLKAYVEENLSKFLLGQRPMSEWDAYLNTLDEMGAQELLDIYSDAYDRAMK